MNKMCGKFKPFLTIWAFFFLFVPILGHAQSDLLSREKTLSQEMAELSKLTFDDLMNLEITSVSKKAQKVSEAAAAIFVVTSEDIRRSGVTSIPEALCMVPGLQVARIDASKWAITSRGFNGRFANKLLVLIDGHSVYTPLCSGVLWDIQDTLYPDSRDDNLFSAFVQDEIILVDDRLHLTLGSKFEHNDYTGFEIQPNARLMWMPHSRHSIWTAVSRAVRTPSRSDHDLRYNMVFPPNTLYPGSQLAVSSLFGNNDFESEELIAYELGYRVQPMDRFSLDIVAFFNDYDNLRTYEQGEPFPEASPSPPHLPHHSK
ncbi:MAG: TonB-dependent receptor [Desulfobacteraceae bacterium]|nr:TonB-dependent receptor [Desulfobacteraceae bacterium]MBC2719017.1 TonB-dependent receptor [Desulfobacteraceae bacterium]